MNKYLKFCAVSAVAISMSGCMAHSNEGVGTLIGGVAGGVVGNQFGSGSGKTAATALGAVIGAVTGSNVGRSMDRPRNVIIHNPPTVRGNNHSHSRWRNYRGSCNGYRDWSVREACQRGAAARRAERQANRERDAYARGRGLTECLNGDGYPKSCHDGRPNYYW